MEQPGDYYLVAVTEDHAFRVVTVRTTDTVRGAVQSQHTRGATARRFGQLLTGTVLVRVTMAPKMRVQGILQGASGSGQIVAESHPDGWCRGLARPADDDAPVDIGGSAVLQMNRSLPSGSLHRGLVEVSTEGGLSASLTTYMARSEQVVSTVGVACITDGADQVRAAGGYLIQVLPEFPEGSLAVMTERLEHDFAALEPLIEEHDASPQALLDALLDGMPYRREDEAPVRFGCNCSDVRVMTSLATLDRSEIEQILEDGEALDISCDYCGTQYEVDPARLRGLLEQS